MFMYLSLMLIVNYEKFVFCYIYLFVIYQHVSHKQIQIIKIVKVKCTRKQT